MHLNTYAPPRPNAVSLALFFSLAAFVQSASASCPSGSLDAYGESGDALGACPLEHTDVTVDIAGFIARVTVVQVFGNPFTEPIEAVYTFPMSHRAAVDQMLMKIGYRTIKGVVKEREEARRIYEAARRAGQAASLLDQERPNIFTQSVANILPGNRIEITISYVEYLQYEAGEYQFSFPMTIGPRYIPGGAGQVPDAGRVTPPVTPEGTRAGHDISLTATIDAGLPLQGIRSELHAVDIQRPAPEKAVLRLKNQQEIPNRDFILKYAVAGRQIGDAVLTHATAAREGFFSLVLYPPERVRPDMATPKEMIFVIDCSGSMSGFPIEKAKKTMRLCIEQMNPKDTFNLISFAGGTGYCFDQSVPNTFENRQKALEYLANLQGGGGTEMMRAIRAALSRPRDDLHLRIVCFMTDGFIGNDMEILGEIKANVGNSRVFSFGIGNSVNRFLIEQMARAGRGAAEVITLESQSDTAAQRFFERIHSPVLTDIQVDFGDLDIRQVFPAPGELPDLFSAQPVVLTGRYNTPGAGMITLRGNTSSGPFKRAIPVALPETAPEHDVLAPLWARAKIDALMAEDWQGMQQGAPKADIKEKITRLGLKFSLATQFTSFVAVEEKVINEGGESKRVEVPVEMPDGVSYEGIFGGQAPGRATKGCAAMRATEACASLEAVGYLSDSSRGAASMPAPAQANRRTAPEPEQKAQEQPPATAHPEKLDLALRDLAAKLVHGAYQSDEISVRDGWLRCFIVCSEITDEHLNALRALGVEVISVARSSSRILAKIKIDRLDAITAFAWVNQITPPRY